MSKERKSVKEGDWINPIQKGYEMECCDCGLVHVLNFRVEKGKAQFQVFRDQRSTGQTRRYIEFDDGIMQRLIDDGIIKEK